jgi:predicted amidophosphoribosyltransferase
MRPFGRLVDLVYPPGCVVCGIATGRHNGLCPTCWSGLRFIERPYCETLGIPFSHDLGSGILSAEAIANPPPFDRLRSAAFHDEPVRQLVHGLKYRDRTDLAPMMAEWMLRASDGMVERCDAILPVPLHRSRMFSRKFNQAAELARHLAQRSGRALLPATLMRVKRTRPRVGLGAEAREEMFAVSLPLPRRGTTTSSASGLSLSMMSTRPVQGCRGGETTAQGRSGGHHGFDLCKGSFRNYMTKR